MSKFYLIFVILQALGVWSAGTPCKRDACYNAVATSSKGRPNLNSRRVDCSAALKTIIEDNVKTITINSFATVVTSTTVLTSATITRTQVTSTVTSVTSTVTSVTSTITSALNTITSATVTFTSVTGTETLTAITTSTQGLGRRGQWENVLEVRDKIIVSGTRSAYVTSACANIQSYASACLCFGIRPTTLKIPKTTTTVIRLLSTGTITTTFTDTTSYIDTTTYIDTTVFVDTTTYKDTTIFTDTTSLVATTTTTTTVTPLPTDNTSCKAVALDSPVDGIGGYNEQFKGSGVRTNPADNSGNNPSGPHQPQTKTIPKTTFDCDALRACANYAATLSSTYYSFDLHFLEAEDRWSCTAYFDGGQSADDFTVADSNVGTAYGYNHYAA